MKTGENEIKNNTVTRESFFYWDEQMRMKAFNYCPLIPKEWSFCETSGKCIDRELINFFWERMVVLN